MSEQLQPIKEPYSKEVAEILSGYPQTDGYILKLFRVFANSIRFLRKGVLNLLDKDSPLSLRTREIVILRVTANLNCEYEWGVHVAVFAEHAGFLDSQVRATQALRTETAVWSEEENLLIRVVDELCATGSLQKETSMAFATTWTRAQQLEIFALCGNYHTISFVANVARLEGEDFAARFEDYKNV
jgi:alkylhydroperoxidase family enzyme